MAEQMHAVRNAKLRREAVQVFPVLADADQGVMRVDAPLSKERQRPNHTVEALAPLQSPNREDQALSRCEPEARAQHVTGDPRPEPVFVDRRVDHRDAPWIDAEQTRQRLTCEIAVGEHRVGAPEHEAHQREFPAATPVRQLFTVGVDQRGTPDQPRDRPSH